METTRRDLLKHLALASVALLTPSVVGCSSTGAQGSTTTPTPTPTPSSGGAAAALPAARPEGWDAIAFNRERGNAGAVPESYRAQINGPDAERMHIGKHLPYLPTLAPGAVPAGMLGVMFGDPSLGRTRHPNDAPSEAMPQGHWFEWVKVRKATEGEAQEAVSRFGAWPTPPEGDNGRFIPQEGTDLAADHGKNTVYLVALPPDVRPGDVVRIHGRCISHGEYVDFVTLPA
ncbi:MAG: hypothetical protein R3A48_26410 [Polyangiales bacterium]